MKMSQAVFYGASGNQYVFQVYPIDTQFLNLGGVYIFTKQSVDHQGKISFQPLYIGQTNSLTQRLTPNHEAWNTALRSGFDTLCVYIDINESSRMSSERDLINNYNPPYNLVHTHNSTLSPRIP